GEGGDLGEDALGGVGVEVAELAGIEFLVDAQDLEHVELEVSDVALVMTHDGLLRSTGRCRCSCRDAGPCWSRATATYSSVTRRMLVRCHPTVQGEEAFCFRGRASRGGGSAPKGVTDRASSVHGRYSAQVPRALVGRRGGG